MRVTRTPVTRPRPQTDNISGPPRGVRAPLHQQLHHHLRDHPRQVHAEQTGASRLRVPAVADTE